MAAGGAANKLHIAALCGGLSRIFQLFLSQMAFFCGLNSSQHQS